MSFYPQDVRSSLAANQHQYNTTEELSRRIASSASGQDRIRHEMALLTDEVSSIESAVDSTDKALRAALETLQDYEAANVELTEWMSDAETRLQSCTEAWDLPPPQSLQASLQVFLFHKFT